MALLMLVMVISTVLILFNLMNRYEGDQNV
jgi:hypothetical protein